MHQAKREAQRPSALQLDVWGALAETSAGKWRSIDVQSVGPVLVAEVRRLREEVERLRVERDEARGRLALTLLPPRRP